MVDDLKIDHFLPRLHQMFRIEVEKIGRIEIELTEVNEHGSRDAAPDIRQRPFSLIFRGSLLGPEKNLYLSQGTYTMEHGELGAFDIFLVPIGPDKEGMRYEAVFN